MVNPNLEKPYKVEIDALGFALEGQLGQQDKEGRLYPIAFFLKKLYRLELHYLVPN